MDKLNELKKQLIADGHLSADDVARLRTAIFEGELNTDTGDFIYSLKDTMSKGHVAPEFKDLFVDTICAILLEDHNSPGEIDESEAKWLRAKIQNNGTLDAYDKAVLKELRQRSINYPPILNYKGPVTRYFERGLYFTRFLTLLAVFGSLLSALALFVKGTIIVVDALKLFFKNITSPHYEHMLEMFVSSIDVFLFAMVLIIFGIGIYEMFITKIDPVLQKVDGRPSWMHISNVDDLKSSLGKVILMVLIVTFFKHSIEVEYGNVNDLLKLGFGIVLIALALFITAKSHH